MEKAQRNARGPSAKGPRRASTPAWDRRAERSLSAGVRRSTAGAPRRSRSGGTRPRGSCTLGGGVIQGVHNLPGRVPALQTCLEKGWGPGTKLASTQWKTPRKIAGELDTLRPNARQFVRLMVLKPNGLGLKEEYLYTLPEDVRLLAEAESAPTTLPGS